MTELIRVSEAARQVGVAPETIRVWCKRGLLRFVTLPSGERRILGSELERLLVPSAKKNEQAAT